MPFHGKHEKVRGVENPLSGEPYKSEFPPLPAMPRGRVLQEGKRHDDHTTHGKSAGRLGGELHHGVDAEPKMVADPERISGPARGATGVRTKAGDP